MPERAQEYSKIGLVVGSLFGDFEEEETDDGTITNLPELDRKEIRNGRRTGMPHRHPL